MDNPKPLDELAAEMRARAHEAFNFVPLKSGGYRTMSVSSAIADKIVILSAANVIALLDERDSDKADIGRLTSELERAQDELEGEVSLHKATTEDLAGVAAEIERLTRERDEARIDAKMREVEWLDTRTRAEAAEARVAELVEALRDRVSVLRFCVGHTEVVRGKRASARGRQPGSSRTPMHTSEGGVISLTEDEVRELLLRCIEQMPRPLTKRGVPRAGVFGLRAWCRENNVASTHASEFMNRKRGPQSDLLAALGLEVRIVRACDKGERHDG